MSQSSTCEKRNRIRVSLFAYAYECENKSLVADEEFDLLCLKIKPKEKTDNKHIDVFFRHHFNPSTGLWIHRHPGFEGIKNLYKRVSCHFEKNK
jgi:hypothetical protein